MSRFTSEELDRLQGVCDAATAGPWDVQIGSDSWDFLKVFVDFDNPAQKEDKRFMNESRTAMPLLIAEVRELQAENARLRSGEAVKDGIAAGILIGSMIPPNDNPD